MSDNEYKPPASLGQVPADVVQQFMQSVSIPLLAWNEEGVIVHCTRHAADVLLSKVSDVAGFHALDALPVRDRAILRSHLDAVIGNQHSARCEFELVLQDASRHWVRLISEPGIQPDGKRLCWSSVENLTQIKRMEKTEALFQRAASIQGTAASLNEFSTQIFDLLRILFGIENSYLALVNHHNGMLDFPFFMDQCDPVPESRKPGNGMTDYVITMGRLVWLHDARSESRVAELGFQILGSQPSDWIGVPLVVDKKIVGMIAVQSYEAGFVFNAKDIGLMLGVGHLFEVFLQRLELIESQKRLSLAIEQAAETVVITDAHGIIQYVNPAFTKTSGFTSDEALGKDSRMLKSGRHDAAYYRELWATLNSGQTWRGLFTNKRKDGVEYEEEAIISPVRNSEGTVVNFVAVKRDVTRENRLEGQFLYAQKMQAATKLVEGISHDFRNLLMVIRQNAENLQQSSQSASVSEELVHVLKATEQSESLIRQLSLFSSNQQQLETTVDVNALIQQFEHTLRSVLKETQTLHVNLSARSPLIRGMKEQIEQVLANVVINASDAMHDGGEIELSTGIEPMQLKEKGRYAFPLTDCETAMAFIEVSDQGSGIADEQKAKLFSPEYRSKTDQNQGMGLVVSQEIMHRHKGNILVRDAHPCGTSIKLYFPVMQQPVTEPVLLTPTPPSLIRGSETILLAEDEEGTRRVISRMLQDQGYTVLEAENGSAAIRSLLYHSGKVDLLLTDIMMPDFDGRALAEQILGLQPDMRVIYISGYNEAHLEESGILAPGERIDIIKKPFRREDLMPKIREVLDQKPS